MKLTEQQLDNYQQRGFLLLENWFTKQEVELMLQEMPAILSEDSPRRILEKNGAVRTIFKPEESSALYASVSKMKRMVEPVRQLLGCEVYIHQSKLNTKHALVGDWWEWHQDFLYWHKEDGMPRPDVLTAVIFLHDVNEFNGPMLVIPGTHTDAVIMLEESEQSRADLESSAYSKDVKGYISTLTANLKYKTDKDTIKSLVDRNGIESVKGKCGSLFLFHGNLYHASSNNLSPYDRSLLMFTYNRIDNNLSEVVNPRPDFIANRNFSAIKPVPDESVFASHINM